MRLHLNQTQEKYLPLIYPFVFYTGDESIHSTRNLFDLYEDKQQKLAKQWLFGPYRMIDVKTIQDEKFRKHPWSGPLGFVFKHHALGDLIHHFQVLMEMLQSLPQDGEDYIRTMLRYILSQTKKEDIKKMHPETEEEIDPWYPFPEGSLGEYFAERAEEKVRKRVLEEGLEQGKQQGLEQGLEQGKQQAKLAFAKKCLAMQLSIEQTVALTGLSREEIIALQADLSA